uniref:Uncharacterized protein n=1 Tax=Anopheles arabiensis TaxID=7173 RepID=A0A182IHG3_ANOAR
KHSPSSPVFRALAGLCRGFPPQCRSPGPHGACVCVSECSGRYGSGAHDPRGWSRMARNQRLDQTLLKRRIKPEAKHGTTAASSASEANARHPVYLACAR